MPLQDAHVKEITGRLDVMAALFAREFSNIDAIVKLENMKLSREQIAEALGITTQNVRQQLYMASKKAKKNEGQAVAAELSTEASSTAEEEA